MMSKTGQATCDDCYFRRAGLCALAGDAICPTFRAVKRVRDVVGIYAQVEPALV